MKQNRRKWTRSLSSEAHVFCFVPLLQTRRAQNPNQSHLLSNVEASTLARAGQENTRYPASSYHNQHSPQISMDLQATPITGLKTSPPSPSNHPCPRINRVVIGEARGGTKSKLESSNDVAKEVLALKTVRLCKAQLFPAFKHAASTNTGNPLISAQGPVGRKTPMGNSPSSCQHSRTPFVCICSNPAMKHRLLYTSPFCVITEGTPSVPSWVHSQVQEALLMGISPQLVNKIAMLHLPHLIEPAKASTVAAKTRSTVPSAPPCMNWDSIHVNSLLLEGQRDRKDTLLGAFCSTPARAGGMSWDSSISFASFTITGIMSRLHRHKTAEEVV